MSTETFGAVMWGGEVEVGKEEGEMTDIGYGAY